MVKNAEIMLYAICCAEKMLYAHFISFFIARKNSKEILKIVSTEEENVHILRNVNKI